jgi:hypothetical protein
MIFPYERLHHRTIEGRFGRCRSREQGEGNRKKRKENFLQKKEKGLDKKNDFQ